jgi:hypothetical protein
MAKLGEEDPPTDESAVLLKIESIIQNQYANGLLQHPTLAMRDAHLKSHGCVRADFIVEDKLDVNLKHGIFRVPRSYPAWIRFSSGALVVQSDKVRCVHGMAIKLLDVDGEKILEDEKQARTHDFLMANHNVFFVRNAFDYLRFTADLAAKRTFCFFVGWNPLRWRLRELAIAFSATFGRIASPLEVRYWSQTPYKLGDAAMKFSARPSSLKTARIPSPAGANYLEDAMAKRLKCDDFWFDFLVQRQTDPIKMPVEDPTIVWDESLSPFQKVAVIRIAKQDFDCAARKEFGENLSYTPWHALPDHRPLGGINRVRREVYRTISILRHRYNHVSRQEPTDSSGV